MAIRPVDLQLAYLAAPQNAAQASAAQNAPQAAQQAAQASFVAELVKREESVAETAHAENSGIQTNADREGDGSGYTPEDRGGRTYSDGEDAPLGFAADGEHFIDITV